MRTTALALLTAVVFAAAVDGATVQDRVDQYVEFLLGVGAAPASPDANFDGTVNVADLLRTLFLNVGPATQIRLTPEFDTPPNGRSFDVFIDLLDADGRLVNPGTEGSTQSPVSVMVTVDGAATLNGGPQQSVEVTIASPEGGRVTVDPNAVETFNLTVQETSAEAAAPRPNTFSLPDLSFGVNESGSVSGQVMLDPIAPAPVQIRIERRIGDAFDPNFMPVEFRLAISTAPWSVAGLEPGIYTFYFTAQGASLNGKLYVPVIRQLQVTAGEDLSDVSVLLVERTEPGAIDLTAMSAVAAPLSGARGFIDYDDPAFEIYPGFRQEFGIEGGSAQIGGFAPGNRIFISAERRDPNSGELEEITGDPVSADITAGPPVPVTLQTQVPTMIIPINRSLAPRTQGAPRIQFSTDLVTPLPNELKVTFATRFGRRSEFTLPVQPSGPGQGVVTVPPDEILRDFHFGVTGPAILRTRLSGLALDGTTLTSGDLLLVAERLGVPSVADQLDIATPSNITSLFPSRVDVPRGTNLPFRVNMRGVADLGLFGSISVITNPLSPLSLQGPLTYSLSVEGSGDINNQGVADTGLIAGPDGDFNLVTDDVAEFVVLVASFGTELEPGAAGLRFYNAATVSGRVNTLNGADSQPIPNGGARIHAIPVGGFEPSAVSLVQGDTGSFIFQGLPGGDYIFLSIPLITDPMGDRYPPDCQRATVVNGQTTSNLAFIHQSATTTGRVSGVVRDHEGTAVTRGTVRAFRTDPGDCMDLDPTAGVLTAASEGFIAPEGFYGVQRLGGTYTVIAEFLDFANNRDLTNGRGQEVTVNSGEMIPFDIVVTPVGAIEPIRPVAFERVPEGEVSLMWNPRPLSGTPIDRFTYELIIRDQLGDPIARFTGIPQPSFVFQTPEFRPGIYQWEIRGFRDDGLESLEQAESPLTFFEVVGPEFTFD